MAEDKNSKMSDEDYVYDKEAIDEAIAKFRGETKGKKKDKKKKDHGHSDYNNDYNDYYQEGTDERKLNGKAFMIFFLALVLLVGVGLCLYFFVFAKGEESSEFDNITVNDDRLGTITTVVSEGDNTVTINAYPNSSVTFMGWARGDIFGNIVISEDSSITLSLNDEANYIALFNQTSRSYSDGSLTYTLFNEAHLATVTGVDSFDSSTLTLPSIVNVSYQVYKIDDNALSGLDLTEITISEKIIDVGEGNIVGENLASINVSSLNNIYYSYNGSALIERETSTLIAGTTNGQLPEGIVEITSNAYNGNNITSLEVPASVKRIGANAFANCQMLEKVTFAEGSTLESLGQSAFAGCTSLKSINIPSSITKIEDNTFDGCASLNSVEIEGSNIEIGQYAFRGNESLAEFDFSKISSIGRFSFDGAGLTTLTLPDNVVSLSEGAFANSSLESVDLTQNTQLVGLSAQTFRGCEALESVVIPSQYLTIGEYCFSGCSALSQVSFEDNSSLHTIYDNAFNSCTAIQSITFPASLRYIEDYAFTNSGLTTIDFSGENLERIGEYCFDETSLTGKIVFPSSLKEIEQNAFFGNDITSLVFEGNIENIRSSAFSQNNNLSSVIFYGEEVVNIEYMGLPNPDTICIYVPEQSVDDYRITLTSYSERIFVGEGSFEQNNLLFAVIEDNHLIVLGVTDENIETIAIGESVVYEGESYVVTAIDNNAFSGLTSLKTLTLPSTVNKIGTTILQGCTSLNLIVIAPENTTYSSGDLQIIDIASGEPIDLGL